MKRSRLAAGLMAAIVFLASLACMCALSCIPGSGDEAGTESAETLSVRLLSDADEEEDASDEDGTVEVKQWVRVTFDVCVLALSVGIIVLAWWAVKKVTKKYGGSNRRFG